MSPYVMQGSTSSYLQHRKFSLHFKIYFKENGVKSLVPGVPHLTLSYYNLNTTNIRIESQVTDIVS